MGEFFRHLLTGKDNKTWHFGKVLGLIAFLVGMGLEVYCVLHSKSFDFTAYGAGIAGVALGIAGLIKLQETSEPQPPKNESN